MQIVFPQIAPTIQILFGFYVAYIFIEKDKFYEKLIEKIWNSFGDQNKIISQTQKDLDAIISSFDEFKDDEWAKTSKLGDNQESFVVHINEKINSLKSSLAEFTKKYNSNKGNLYNSKTFSYISLNQAIYCLVILVITSLKNPIEEYINQFLIIFASTTSLYLYLCWAYECTITTSKIKILSWLKSIFYKPPQLIKLFFNLKWCKSKHGEQIAIYVLPITIFLTIINLGLIRLLNLNPIEPIISLYNLYWWILLLPIINIGFYTFESKRRASVHKETFKIEFNDSITLIQDSIRNLNHTITSVKTSATLKLRFI